MSYFVIGVGGTGAKLLQTMVHLTAAGLLPERGRALNALLVDPDQTNGNVESARTLAALYSTCRNELRCGTSDLFKNPITVDGPLTPVVDPQADSMSTIFGYQQMRENAPDEADLMDLLFAPVERDLQIHLGFRGRPAIGSTIFGRAVNFRVNGRWRDLREAVRGAATANASVPVLLTGSVFGGSGAAGVPTICRLLADELRGVTKNVRMGLALFLPYFSFRPVEGEEVQADPNAFATATAESLKYYDEGKFLEFCQSIYAVGDELRAEMSASAVGAAEQKNDPHYVELVAGLGAMRFMSGAEGGEVEGEEPHRLSTAQRLAPLTVRWADLPRAGGNLKPITQLQTMTLFAVAFKYIFYPNIVADLKNRRPRLSFVVRHLDRKDVDPQIALAQLANLEKYVTLYLQWLLSISTPREVPNFVPGLVKLSVFATPVDDGWRLKTPDVSDRGEFRSRELDDLFVNAEGQARPKLRDVFNGADRAVDDPTASGTGVLVRAIYDSCNEAIN